jgi:hypothetical protein
MRQNGKASAEINKEKAAGQWHPAVTGWYNAFMERELN